MTTPAPAGLAALEERLRHAFGNTELLVEALRHASSRTAATRTNERLEFLGDAVLGLIVARELYVRYPEADEGWMTRIRSAVVSRRNLALKARELGLAEFMVTGKMFAAPRDLTGSILSNGLEAIIAAIYVDGGLEAATAFVLQHFGRELSAAAEGPSGRDYKSRLSEFAQQHLGTVPSFELVSVAGPDHTRVFEMAAVIGGRRFPAAWGRSKKEAGQRASLAALRELGQVTDP